MVEPIGLDCGPPKSVKPRVPRSCRVSRDLARAQVTPKSGRRGLMGGRLNNWIDSKTQKYRWRQILLCYSCKGEIRRVERKKVIESAFRRVCLRKWICANGSEYKWKMVGLSERGCRRRKKTSQPGSVSAKKSMLLVFSVFAVRTTRFYPK